MFFKKNTLTLDEITDAIVFISLLSIGFLIKKGRLLDDKQRVKLWEQRKVIYSGDCSNWHASKICVNADNLARYVASNELLFENCQNVLNEGTQEDKEELQAELATVARAMAVEGGLL